MSNNYYSKPKRKKEDPLEVKLLVGIVRGLAWLVMLPFGKKPGSGSNVRKAGALDTQEIGKRWNDIQTSIGLGGATHFGSAVVSADKLLDFVLRHKGYAGDTMGERLKSARDDLSPAVYHNVWQAHKLRNQLVHELQSEVMSYQAKEAISQFEAALRELGALR